MSLTIRQHVTANADHEIVLRDGRIPAGARVEVVVTFETTDAPARDDKQVPGPSPNQWLWDLVARAGGSRSAQDILQQLRQDRDAWDTR